MYTGIDTFSLNRTRHGGSDQTACAVQGAPARASPAAARQFSNPITPPPPIAPRLLERFRLTTDTRPDRPDDPISQSAKAVHNSTRQIQPGHEHGPGRAHQIDCAEGGHGSAQGVPEPELGLSQDGIARHRMGDFGTIATTTTQPLQQILLP